MEGAKTCFYVFLVFSEFGENVFNLRKIMKQKKKSVNNHYQPTLLGFKNLLHQKRYITKKKSGGEIEKFLCFSCSVILGSF